MLHEKLKKMMSGKSNMPDHEKQAKMDVVKHLRDMASGAMKDKVGSLHKVSVASDSAEGLKHGLQQAQKVVGQSSDADADGDSSQPGMDTDADGMHKGGEVGEPDPNKPEHDSLGEQDQMVHDASNSEHDALSAHQEHDPDEDMDEDALNAKLEKLMKMKASKSKKSNNPY